MVHGQEAGDGTRHTFRVLAWRLVSVPFTHPFAASHTRPETPVIDTERAPLRTVRHQRRQQIGELGVPTVLPHEPLDVLPLASLACAQTTSGSGPRRSDTNATVRPLLPFEIGHMNGRSAKAVSCARSYPSNGRFWLQREHGDQTSVEIDTYLLSISRNAQVKILGVLALDSG
jgi:hypothetical protein